MIILLIATLIIPLASFQPYTQAAPSAQVQPARSAEQKAAAEAQQQAIERQLREKNLNVAEQQRLIAELERARAESQITADERAKYEAQIRALEAQLRAAREVVEAQRQHALEDALHLELSEKAQRENAAQGEAMLRLKRAELEAELMRLRTQYTENHPTMLEKRAQLESLNRTHEDFVNSNTRSNMQAMLLLKRAEVEAQLRTLRRTYKEQHPDVQAVKAQLEALKKEIEQIRK